MTNTISSKALKQIVENEIYDSELRKRLARLGAPHLDTLIREAGVVLEDRLRSVTGLSDVHGVKLVDDAFDVSNMKMIYSQHPGEQDGVRMLYRGAMQFIRNPPMHKLVEYPIEKARLLLRLIDSLLLLLPRPIVNGNPSQRPPKIASSFEFLEKVKEKGPSAYEVMKTVLAKMQEIAEKTGNRFKIGFLSVTANLYWRDKKGHWRRFFVLNSKMGAARVRMDYLRKGGYDGLATKLGEISSPLFPNISDRSSGTLKVTDVTADDLCQLVEKLANVFPG